MPIKIIDLQAEDNPTNDDLIVIRDNLTQTTRKVTREKFFANPPIPSKAITNDMLGDGAVSKRNLGPDAKIGVKSINFTSPSALTPDMSNYDVFNVTALNSGMSIYQPITKENLAENQGIMFRIRDNGTAQGLGWDTIYRPIGVTLPGATVANQLLYVAGRWNKIDQRVDILSIGRQ